MEFVKYVYIYIYIYIGGVEGTGFMVQDLGMLLQRWRMKWKMKWNMTWKLRLGIGSFSNLAARSDCPDM